MLVVAPLAGAYPILFRDVVVGLLRHANVAITDWRDPYYVPKSRGEFGLAENISYVLEMIRAIGPGGHVIGICQGAVSALAATALLSTLDEAAAPRSLTLIAGPIDPLANPTRVGLASRAFPPEFQHNVMRSVPDRFPGRGRRIYPANAQFTALIGCCARHGLLGDVFWKLWQDDGEDPLRFPFSSSPDATHKSSRRTRFGYCEAGLRGKTIVHGTSDGAQERLVQHRDRPEPFHARHAVPARHHQPQWKPMHWQQRLSVRLPSQHDLVPQRLRNRQAPLERMLDAKIDTGVPASEEDFDRIIEQAGLLQSAPRGVPVHW